MWSSLDAGEVWSSVGGGDVSSDWATSGAGGEVPAVELVLLGWIWAGVYIREGSMTVTEGSGLRKGECSIVMALNDSVVAEI